MVMGNFYLTMEETAEEFYEEAERYNSVDCPKSAELWKRMGIMKVMFLVTLMKF